MDRSNRVEHQSDANRYVVRFQRRYPVKALSVASLATAAAGLSVWMGDLGAVWLFAVIFVVGLSTAPALWRGLRRDVALAVDRDGIYLDRPQGWRRRARRIPWPQIGGVRIYTLQSSWDSDPGRAYGYDPMLHVDLTNGEAVRASAHRKWNLDPAAVAAAVHRFRPQAPVSIEGTLDLFVDPLHPPVGLPEMAHRLRGWAERMQARHGRPPR